MSDLEFLTDPELQINFFSNRTHSTCMTDIIVSSFSSVEEVLKELRFALRDSFVGQYILPPPGLGTMAVHNHAPFSLHGWNGHMGTYQLHYSSLHVTGTGTTDLERCLKHLAKPWDVKIVLVTPSPPTENKGDFFDRPLPKRLSKIISY